MNNVATQETEVIVAKAKRRRFSAKYKLDILRRVEACRDQPGKIGELLRKEGLYSSHLTDWRREREAGELAGLEPRKRGPNADPETAQDRELAQLRRENAGLKARLERAETIIEVQKNHRARQRRSRVGQKLAGRSTIARREEWPSSFWCSANP